MAQPETPYSDNEAAQMLAGALSDLARIDRLTAGWYKPYPEHIENQQERAHEQLRGAIRWYADPTND